MTKNPEIPLPGVERIDRRIAVEAGDRDRPGKRSVELLYRISIPEDLAAQIVETVETFPCGVFRNAIAEAAFEFFSERRERMVATRPANREHADNPEAWDLGLATRRDGKPILSARRTLQFEREVQSFEGGYLRADGAFLLGRDSDD